MKREIKFTVHTDIRKAKRQHRDHQCGAGEHDSRPKRQRTRQSQRRLWEES